MNQLRVNEMENKKQNFWKKCSTCKKELPFSTMYYRCSVSTCQHKRKGFYFCSVPCWSGHLGYANHRQAWAEEVTSPSQSAFETEVNSNTTILKKEAEVDRVPRRRVVEDSDAVIRKESSNIKTDTLVVVSKVKALIKEQSGFSTSQCCIDALTKKVVDEALKAIVKAENAERKTVMGRDVV